VGILVEMDRGLTLSCGLWSQSCGERQRGCLSRPQVLFEVPCDSARSLPGVRLVPDRLGATSRPL